MNSTEIKAIIKEQLPTIIVEDPSIRDFVLHTVSEYYHPKTEVDSKFDRILAELQSDRAAPLSAIEKKKPVNGKKINGNGKKITVNGKNNINIIEIF